MDLLSDIKLEKLKNIGVDYTRGVVSYVTPANKHVNVGTCAIVIYDGSIYIRDKTERWFSAATAEAADDYAAKLESLFNKGLADLITSDPQEAAEGRPGG